MSRFGHVQSARRSGRSGRGKPNANDDHRHLNESQRAMVAAKVRPHFEKRAKERMEAGAKHGGETAGKGRPKQDDSPVAKRAEGYRQQQSLASEQAGAALSVSRQSVDRAMVESIHDAV